MFAGLKWLLFVFLGFLISGFIGVLTDKMGLFTNLFGKQGSLISQQVNDIWWFIPLVLLNVLVFHYVVGWWGKQGLAWLLVAPMLVYTLTNFYTDGTYWNQTTVIYLIGALVVGFTEEYLFRGTLMSALDKAGVGATGLVWLSAVIFAAFHLVNSLATGDIIAMAFQVILTLGWGVFQGAIYQKTKALLPLAISHGLYDFSVLAPGHAVVNFGGIVNNVLPAVVLAWLGIWYMKKVNAR